MSEPAAITARHERLSVRVYLGRRNITAYVKVTDSLGGPVLITPVKGYAWSPTCICGVAYEPRLVFVATAVPEWTCPACGRMWLNRHGAWSHDVRTFEPA